MLQCGHLGYALHKNAQLDAEKPRGSSLSSTVIQYYVNILQILHTRIWHAVLIPQLMCTSFVAILSITRAAKASFFVATRAVNLQESLPDRNPYWHIKK